MNRRWPVVAAAILVVIGAVEATLSVEGLRTLAGRPQLSSGGLALSAAGLLLSAIVYLALGRGASGERDAVRAGATAGAIAGAIGGTLRALIVSEAVADAVAHYASVPDWFVPGALAAFVVLAVAGSVLGGAALAWTGRRFGGGGPV